MPDPIIIQNHPVTVTGRIARVGRLRDEFYDFIEDPAAFIADLKNQRPCDLFTFIQEVPERSPRFEYHFEQESLAVLPIITYEHWWKKQINDKIRNMVRKGPKLGLEVRKAELNDELVAGIARICDETPIRQGRRFKHYGKPIEQVKKEHASYLNRSEFLAAYFRDELVGYIKLVHGRGISNLMQILSLNAHRDKSPTNLLLAKSIERCAEKEVPLLQYGSWSRRSMGDFKKRHAFERWEVPRYYVPITLMGQLLLRSRLHRNLTQIIPETWLDRGANLRSRFHSLRGNGAFKAMGA